MAYKNPNIVTDVTRSDVSLSNSDYVIPSSTAAGTPYQEGFRPVSWTPSEIQEFKALPDVFSTKGTFLTAKRSDTELINRNLRTETEVAEINALPNIVPSDSEMLKTAVERATGYGGPSHSVYVGPALEGVSSNYVFEYQS